MATETTEGRNLFQKIAKTIAIENLEPNDLFLRLTFPKMIKEHLVRYHFAVRTMREYFDQTNQITVLDVACGRGYGTNILKTGSDNGKVMGIDIKFPYAKKAHQKYEEIQFITGDAAQLPVAKETADVLVSFETVEHLPKEAQPEFIKEIYRVLKPGGIAIVSITYPYSLPGLGANPRHLHEPTSEELKKLFANNNLELKDQFGQIFVKPEQAEKAKKLNKIIPIWPIFAWNLFRNVEIGKVPKDSIALTNIYVFQKSA